MKPDPEEIYECVTDTLEDFTDGIKNETPSSKDLLANCDPLSIRTRQHLIRIFVCNYKDMLKKKKKLVRESDFSGSNSGGADDFSEQRLDNLIQRSGRLYDNNKDSQFSAEFRIDRHNFAKRALREGRIKELHFAILLLKDVKQLTDVEIAKRLGIKLKTVQTRWSELKRTLMLDMAYAGLDEIEIAEIWTESVERVRKRLGRSSDTDCKPDNDQTGRY